MQDAVLTMGARPEVDTGPVRPALVCSEWLPIGGSAWAGQDGVVYFTDSQLASIAGTEFGFRRLERRLTGGWLERRPGEEPLTVPALQVGGREYFRLSGNWREVDERGVVPPQSQRSRGSVV